MRTSETLHSFSNVIAIGKYNAMTTRTELNRDTHVNTLAAVRASPDKTYVRKVIKLIKARELKKNDENPPCTQDIRRNHFSSFLTEKWKNKILTLEKRDLQKPDTCIEEVCVLFFSSNYARPCSTLKSIGARNIPLRVKPAITIMLAACRPQMLLNRYK